MAGLSMRGQLRAIARVRWNVFLHALRTTRGMLELGASIVMGSLFGSLAIGGGLGLAIAAWSLVSHQKSEQLGLLLWPVFLFWQFFPLMASAFVQNSDSSNLLRFPLTYRAYFLVRLAYGSLDPGTVLGCVWLLAIAIGAAIAAPALLIWTALVLLTFAMMNLFLSRMVFSWIERWLAQRRTREIVGVVFFMLLLSFQLIGPIIGRVGEKSGVAVLRRAQELSFVQRPLPPALAGDAIARATQGQFAHGVLSLVLLAGYAALFVWLLNLRLRAEYHGENLSEAVAPLPVAHAPTQIKAGWRVLGLPGPIAAMFEKEFRYLSRSGPMLYTLIVPVFVLLIFRLGPSGSERGHGFLARTPDLAFPFGAAYALLILTNLVYNIFGGDSGGIQILFASPATFRQVVIGKNLAHMAVYAFEVALLWVAVSLLYRPPSLSITVATLAGILFVLPVDLAAGNLLSIYSPTRMEYGKFGRQRASKMTILAGFAIRILTFGVGATVLVLSRRYGNPWLAAPVFLVLAGLAFALYGYILNRVDRAALDHRETLISELCRA